MIAKGAFGRGAVDLEAGGDGRDVVAVAHPDLFARFQEPAGQQVDALVCGRHIGAAELCRAMAALDLAAQHLHHHLLAIADAQHRHAQIEDAGRRAGRAVVDDAGRATRKDHRFGAKLLQESVCHLLERMDFAIDVQLSQAARDQLRYLAAEVDDQKAVMCFHAKRE